MTKSKDFIKHLILTTYVIVFLSNNCLMGADLIDSSLAVINDKNSKNQISPEEFMFAGSSLHSVNGELPNKTNDIKLWPTVAVGAAYTGVFYLQHKMQTETIWQNTGSFRFWEDGNYALYADKNGHFFGTYFTSYLVRETMYLTGMSWETANIFGAIIGLGYTTYVEVLDGHAEQWGFSPSDQYVNMAGAAFFLAQHYVPVLQNIQPKFSYIPANWHGDKPKYKAEFFIDDYSSQTIWFSVNVHNFLPDDWKKYWPDWLEISLGYTARNLCGHTGEGHNCTEWGPGFDYYDENGYFIVHGDPRYIIALDYNLVKLLPDGGYFWNWLRQTLNLFKLPSPAIEFGRETKFYLMFPFTIK